MDKGLDSPRTTNIMIKSPKNKKSINNSATKKESRMNQSNHGGHSKNQSMLSAAQRNTGKIIDSKTASIEDSQTTAARRSFAEKVKSKLQPLFY